MPPVMDAFPLSPAWSICGTVTSFPPPDICFCISLISALLSLEFCIEFFIALFADVSLTSGLENSIGTSPPLCFLLLLNFIYILQINKYYN